jgi:acetyl-CoA synthetase
MISKNNFAELYQESISASDTFWLEQAKQNLAWITQPTLACRCNWNANQGPIYTQWFTDGILNVSYNCLDRHVAKTPNKTALIWQGEQEDNVITYTYSELLHEVCACAHMLKKCSVQKGSRVAIFLPMIPASVITMLACARIGAIHIVIFSGISAQALALRLADVNPDLLITATHALHNGKTIQLYKTVTDAYKIIITQPKTLVIEHDLAPGTITTPIAENHLRWHERIKGCPSFYDCKPMAAEDTLFILHTSGSTGKPKGLVHTSAGYLLYAALTTKWAFDLQPTDIFWCTADIGWITGHTYGVYGPLANGATILMYESTPLYPAPSRCAHIIHKFGVTTLYTAPTLIRLLATHKDTHGFDANTSASLRILGSVGEVLDSASAQWYTKVIGNNHCSLVNTWWQTETGGIMLAPLPIIHTAQSHIDNQSENLPDIHEANLPVENLSKASANTVDKKLFGIAEDTHNTPVSEEQCSNSSSDTVGLPFFGTTPVLVKATKESSIAQLCFSQPWPGVARTIYNDHACYINTYFAPNTGLYTSGDGAYQDSEHNFYITGRIDDVINVSGHRISAAEVEAAILQHQACSEAAVVGAPHAIKGSCLYAFIITNTPIADIELFEKEVQSTIRTIIGPIAKLDYIHVITELPKTRSGKIMRRILRKIVEGCGSIIELGDLSTIVNQECIATIITERKNT